MASLNTLPAAAAEPVTNRFPVAASAPARERRAELLGVVERLRDLLAEADEHELTLKHRVILLEEALERAERETTRERAFLFEQQDAFIADLVDEHAQQVEGLKRQVASLEQLLNESHEENRALCATVENASLRSEELTRKLSRVEYELELARAASSRIPHEALAPASASMHDECERSSNRSDLGLPVPQSPSQRGSTPIARVAITSVRSLPASAEAAAGARAMGLRSAGLYGASYSFSGDELPEAAIDSLPKSGR